jgi:hypothetical protein
LVVCKKSRKRFHVSLGMPFTFFRYRNWIQPERRGSELPRTGKKIKMINLSNSWSGDELTDLPTADRRLHLHARLLGQLDVLEGELVEIAELGLVVHDFPLEFGHQSAQLFHTVHPGKRLECKIERGTML